MECHNTTDLLTKGWNANTKFVANWCSLREFNAQAPADSNKKSEFY